LFGSSRRGEVWRLLVELAAGVEQRSGLVNVGRRGLVKAKVRIGLCRHYRPSSRLERPRPLEGAGSSGLFLVAVVLVSRHGTGPACFPDARVGCAFAESFGHGADVSGGCAAAGANVIDAHVAGGDGVIGHGLARKLEGLEAGGEFGEAGEIGFAGRGTVSGRLRGDVGADRLAHLADERESVFRIAEAIDADDVGARVGQAASGFAGSVALGSAVGVFEAERDHGGKLRGADAFYGEKSFAGPGKGFADNEIDAFAGHDGKLFVEEAADTIRRGVVLGVIHPGEREIAGDEAAARGGDFGNTNGGAIQFFEAVCEADSGELVAAGVEGERLKDFGARFAKLHVQLVESFGAIERDLRSERAGADPSALLEFEKVAAVAQNDPFLQPSQNTVRHSAILARKVKIEIRKTKTGKCEDARPHGSVSRNHAAASIVAIFVGCADGQAFVEAGRTDGVNVHGAGAGIGDHYRHDDADAGGALLEVPGGAGGWHGRREFEDERPTQSTGFALPGMDW